MSILPSFLADQINEEKNQLLDVPKEYGIDFATGQLTGKIVEGKEAIKVWIWNCLKTQRFPISDLFLGLWDRPGAVHRADGIRRIFKC